MSGLIIVQRQPGTAQVANLRLALIKIAIRENVHSFCEDDCEAFAASGGRGGPVAATSESVGRQSDVRLMSSGKGSPEGGV